MTTATSSHRFPLRSHIRMLCGQIGVELDERDTLDGASAHADQWRGAKLRSNTITVLRVTDLQRYYTALHELGHIALNHRGGVASTPPRIIAKEYEAWDWAIEHGRLAPTPEVCDHINRCIQSYHDHYGLPVKRTYTSPRARFEVRPKGRLP